MPVSAVERYREHPVWELIELKREALRTARFSQHALEQNREDVINILTLATRSKANAQPALYDDVLDDIGNALTQLAADENSFANFMRQSYFPSLRQNVRALPGPPPKYVNDVYVSALSDAIAMRNDELNVLRAKATELMATLSEKSKEVVALSQTISRQRDKITADAATISQVVESAEGQLRQEWELGLATWNQERSSADAAIEQKMAEQIALLATAAVTGRRLVEQAAGQLTARDWAARAKRERLNAVWLRWAAFSAFVLAVVVGGWVLWTAIDKGFTLTIGDGILRGALVLALVGVGSFLSVEGRRHFKEADSAEDVALALTALEPFYASAEDDERAQVRRELGDTVFIRNTLSRFTSRDASKHSGISNQQLNEVVDLISKGADVAKKAGAVQGSSTP